MLYSVAGGSWEPWAAKHLIRFGVCLVMMLGLALVDLRVWFGVGLSGLRASACCCWSRWRWSGDIVAGRAALAGRSASIRFQPSEIMKIGVVLALARFYHGASAKDARLSLEAV